MKLRDIYDFLIQEGLKEDPRSRKEIQKNLLEQKKNYKKAPASVRKFFDKDILRHPYGDTRILNGDLNAEVRRILVGIDIEVGELLMAQQLSRSDPKIDLVLAHHPEGIALASLDEVMSLQTDSLHHAGLGYDVAKDLMRLRQEEVARRLHSANHARTVDAAKLLNVPLMCCHTPADNHVNRYLQNLMDRKKPKRLQDVVDLLYRIPEYQKSVYHSVGPKILLGKSSKKAGKIFVDMTGGTEGSKEVFARLSQAGIKTYLCMHLAEDHFARIKSEYLHVVNAGHIASDNLGMNLLLDKLQKKTKIEIIECSGFRRVKR